MLLFLACITSNYSRAQNVRQPLAYEVKENPISFDYALFSGAMKYINFGGQFQFNYTPIGFLTLNSSASLNNFRMDVYSSSDQHRITNLFFPVTIGGRINMPNASATTPFLFANYGWQFGLGSENNSVKSRPCREFGIGSLIEIGSNENYLKLELGHQKYDYVGQATSTFQSTIDYDLRFSSFFFRVGLVITRE